MGRAVLIAWLPWLALLGAAWAVLWLLVRLNRAKFEWGRLRRLHREESGSVQALSLVLTLPLFVWVLMLIVQVSQLMIGSIVLHYATFCAARAAVVWIPARLEDEPENVIGGGYTLASDVVDGQSDTPTIVDESVPGFGPRDGWLTYIIDVGDPLQPTSRKARKIMGAAVMALAPICPSSSDAGQQSGTWGGTAGDLAEAFSGLAGATAARPQAVSSRLRNKLVYAAEHTRFRVYFRHPNREPPLKNWDVGPRTEDWDEFRAHLAEYGTELGFQDQVTITVYHDFALLPGPGRLLAKAASPGDPLAEALQRQRVGGRHYYLLSASATLGIEGEKPAKRYDEIYD
jgi:hypothetical protein